MDDTTIITNDYNAIEELFKIYTKYSEAKLNMEKTEILRVGNWRTKDPPQGKYKRFIFQEGREETAETNWKKKEETAIKIMRSNEKREVSLFGKILSVNSLVLSQYWHIGAILKLNQKIHKKAL